MLKKYRFKCRDCVFFKSHGAICIDNIGHHFCLKNLNMVTAEMTCTHFKNFNMEEDYREF